MSYLTMADLLRLQVASGNQSVGRVVADPLSATVAVERPAVPEGGIGPAGRNARLATICRRYFRAVGGRRPAQSDQRALPDATLLTGPGATKAVSGSKPPHPPHRFAWILLPQRRIPAAIRLRWQAQTQRGPQTDGILTALKPGPEFPGTKLVTPFGVRQRRRRSPKRRGCLRTPSRVRAGGKRDAGHESLAGERRDQPRSHGGVLRRTSRRPRPR